MHRIDGPGVAFGGLFTEGNPTTGTPATTLTADWRNAVQQELANVIEAAGIALDKPDNAQLLAAIQAMLNTTVPAGTMLPTARSTAPAGYLMCQGQVVSCTERATLFAAIGTAYNTGGEAAGYFRLPDGRGRTLIGAGQGAGLTNRALGTYLGAEAHALTTAEMPSHSHGGTTGVGGDHTHDITVRSGTINDQIARIAGTVSAGDNEAESQTVDGDAIASAGSHNHAIGAEGGEQAHNNMPPSFVGNWMIKT